MGLLAYVLLILLVGGMLLGVALAGAVVGGLVIILFLVGWLIFETINWLKGKLHK